VDGVLSVARFACGGLSWDEIRNVYLVCGAHRGPQTERLNYLPITSSSYNATLTKIYLIFSTLNHAGGMYPMYDMCDLKDSLSSRSSHSCGRGKCSTTL